MAKNICDEAIFNQTSNLEHSLINNHQRSLNIYIESLVDGVKYWALDAVLLKQVDMFFCLKMLRVGQLLVFSGSRTLPTTCLSLFDHFVGLAFKGLT